jgi:hypothetical protein
VGRTAPPSRFFHPNTGCRASPTSFTPFVGAKISAGFIHATALFRIHDAKSLALRRAGPAGMLTTLRANAARRRA